MGTQHEKENIDLLYKFVQVIPLENKQSMKTQRNLLLNCTRSAKWHDVWVSAKITRKIKAQFTIRFRLSATELGLAHMASSSIFQTSITNKLKTNQTPNETMIMTCPSIKNIGKIFRCLPVYDERSVALETPQRYYLNNSTQLDESCWCAIYLDPCVSFIYLL